MVVELIVGKNCVWDDKVIFVVCFIDLEVVICGLLLDEVKVKGFDI